MGTETSDTQAVVQTHLDAFVRQMGVDAIVRDYHDNARFMSEAATYHGKREKRQFLEAFLGSLPPRFRTKD